MTIDEIVAYVMHTPNNTNPAVLKSMLSQLEGGEEGMLVVNITGDDESGFATDKTFAEIVAACPNVVAQKDWDGVVNVYTLSDYSSNYCAFVATEFGTGEMYQYRFVINDDDTVEFDEIDYPN